MSEITATSVPIAWHPGLSVYASEAFLRSVGDTYGWIGGRDQKGVLRCVLPYTVVRKAFLRMVRFRVETIPLFDDFGVEEERAFLNSVVTYFRKTGADMIIPATTNTIFRTFPEGAIAAPYGSYIIDLSQSEETLLANLHSKHRNVLRNAIKKGVLIRSGLEFLPVAHQLVRDTVGRSNLGFMSYADFERFVSSLGQNVKVFIAEHEGIIQGCAVIPYSTHSAYYLYGGSIPEPQTGAMQLLQWEAMRSFRALGVGRYDFVGVRINPRKGSKQQGLKQFKERFGGRLAKGYIWKLGFNPVKFALYSVAARIRSGGDIVDQERYTVTNGSR